MRQLFDQSFSLRASDVKSLFVRKLWGNELEGLFSNTLYWRPVSKKLYKNCILLLNFNRTAIECSQFDGFTRLGS